MSKHSWVLLFTEHPSVRADQTRDPHGVTRAARTCLSSRRLLGKYLWTASPLCPLLEGERGARDLVPSGTGGWERGQVLQIGPPWKQGLDAALQGCLPGDRNAFDFGPRDAGGGELAGGGEGGLTWVRAFDSKET